MRVVKFLEYRQYEALRTEANNAMMALLAGSRLAEHTLQLTEGSERMLPEIFPKVQHIGRFNLRTTVAKEILDKAEQHLGAMAVPYALALHEDHVFTCLGLLIEAGVTSKNKVKALRANEMHEHFALVVGQPLTASSLQIFHLIRLMRNCIIHDGGKADSQLVTVSQGLSPSEAQLWEKLTGRSLQPISQGDHVLLLQGELVAALAVTTRLSEEMNVSLQSAYPRDKWADRLLTDLSTSFPTLPTNPSELLRKVKGYARHHYSALQLTEDELKAALGRAGYRI